MLAFVVAVSLVGQVHGKVDVKAKGFMPCPTNIQILIAENTEDTELRGKKPTGRRVNAYRMTPAEVLRIRAAQKERARQKTQDRNAIGFLEVNTQLDTRFENGERKVTGVNHYNLQWAILQEIVSADTVFNVGWALHDDSGKVLFKWTGGMEDAWRVRKGSDRAISIGILALPHELPPGKYRATIYLYESRDGTGRITSGGRSWSDYYDFVVGDRLGQLKPTPLPKSEEKK